MRFFPVIFLFVLDLYGMESSFQDGKQVAEDASKDKKVNGSSGTCNSKLFIFWLKTMLIPQLKKGQIVIPALIIKFPNEAGEPLLFMRHKKSFG